MLQIGSTIRIKDDAFGFGENQLFPEEIEARGQTGKIAGYLENDVWMIEVNGKQFILEGSEMEEIEAGEAG